MAYVCQLTSAVVSGISGSAQADAAIMTPLLVPAMEREGYPRDVAAAVVAGASIKGPIGPLSVMFIVYGSLVGGASISALLLSGVHGGDPAADLPGRHGLRRGAADGRPHQAALRRHGDGRAHRACRRCRCCAIPVIILGGIFSGVFTPTESASIASVVAIGLALFWFASVAPRELPAILVLAGLETGIVMLLLGDSAILAKALFLDRFGRRWPTSSPASPTTSTSSCCSST